MASKAERGVKSVKTRTSLSAYTDVAAIEMLAQYLESSGVAAITIECGDDTLRIASGASTPVVYRPPIAAPTDTQEREVSRVLACAPLPGTFLQHHPDRSAASDDGASGVEAGQIVGFVQVGPILVAVRAEQGGMPERCVIAEGQVVGYRDAILLERGAAR
jgi:hypothetical protein